MKNKNCTIYIIRHGRTDWNDKKLIQGHTDIPLNPEGEKEAEELARELGKIKFDKAYSSDLSRAKRTAEIITAEHSLVVETTKALRERYFGEIEGKPHAVLKEIDRLLDILDEKARYSYKSDSNPNMESDEEVMNRFLTLLREIAISHAGKKVLIATHGGIVRIFLIKLGLLIYSHDRVEIKNLAYIKLESDGIDFFVKETKGIFIDSEELKNT